MNKQMIDIVTAVAQQKDISVDVIFRALEESLSSVIGKQISATCPATITVNIDRTTGETEITRLWEITSDDYEEINPVIHVPLSDAQQDYEDISVGDNIEEKLDGEKFSRIAYHQAKQVLTRIVRDAKRLKIAEKYQDQVGQILHGKVKHVNNKEIRVEITEEVDGILPRRNLIDREIFRVNDRISTLLTDVSVERGALLQLSRTHPHFVSELFKTEVPEIADGTIQIKACSRDPGSRAKIAVKTNDGRIDPIGACIGMRGSRVQAVTSELNGERIDVVNWDDDPAQLTINVLAPAQIKSISVNEDDHSMDIAVEEDQMAQVIGRSGQNILLASQLVGWELNVMSETDAQEKSAIRKDLIKELLITALDVDEDIADIFIREGYNSVDEIANGRIMDLASIEEFDENIAEALIDRAKQSLVSQAITGEQKQISDLYRIKGMTKDIAKALISNNITNIDQLADLSTDELQDICQVDDELGGKIIMAARSSWFDTDKDEEK